MEYSLKEIGKEFLSVVVGVLVIAAITIPCFVVAALLLVGDDKPPKSQANIAIFLMDFGILAGSFVGGYITASLSTRKNYLPVILTGIVIPVIGVFDISDSSTLSKPDIFFGLGIILLVLLGGYIKLRKRKHRLTDLSFDKEDSDTNSLNF